MTAKEYLQQIHLMDIRIGQRVTQLQQMRDRVHIMGSFDYSKDRVQSTPTSGNKQIEDIVDLENEIKALIENEQNLKHKIISEIQTLADANYVEILYRRYVEMQTFEQISCDLNYAYHYVCTLHGEALKEFSNNVLNFS